MLLIARRDIISILLFTILEQYILYQTERSECHQLWHINSRVSSILTQQSPIIIGVLQFNSIQLIDRFILTTCLNISGALLSKWMLSISLIFSQLLYLLLFLLWTQDQHWISLKSSELHLSEIQFYLEC